MDMAEVIWLIIGALLDLFRLSIGQSTSMVSEMSSDLVSLEACVYGLHVELAHGRSRNADITRISDKYGVCGGDGGSDDVDVVVVVVVTTFGFISVNNYLSRPGSRANSPSYNHYVVAAASEEFVTRTERLS